MSEDKDSLHHKYWKGSGLQPHPNTAISEDDVKPITSDFSYLVSLQRPSVKQTLRAVLLAHLRPGLNVLPIEIIYKIFEIICKGEGKEFVWVSNFDQNGLFWFLGTQKTTVYTPPVVYVTCFSSTNCSGTPNSLLERNGGSGYTQPHPNSHVGVRFRDGIWFSCSNYTYTPRKYGGTPRALRNWEFQGSKDNKTWVVIKKYVDDTSLADNNNASHTFSVDCKGHFYRAFRIVQTGPNAYRNGNMELYGIAYFDDSICGTQNDII